MESRVRSQKSISLSSGESKFVAMVGGCSDGLLVRHLWMMLVKGEVDAKVRSDRSAARAMVQRQGIGRVRHLDAALLWIQQEEKDKILSVNPEGLRQKSMMDHSSHPGTRMTRRHLGPIPRG